MLLLLFLLTSSIVVSKLTRLLLSICASLVSIVIHPLFLYSCVSCLSVYISLVSLLFLDICPIVPIYLSLSDSLS
jgi:hypothetical protein